MRYQETMDCSFLPDKNHFVCNHQEEDETKLEEFLGKYENSEIKSFCNRIKKDIAPVKNSISLSISSEFVEGNNNKFKLLKRIVYGRSGLVNLTKKCKLAFIPKNEEFKLSSSI